MKHRLLLLDGIRTHMPKKKKTLKTKLLKIDHILESNIGTCCTMQQLQCKLLPQRPKVKIKYKLYSISVNDFIWYLTYLSDYGLDI